MIPSGIRDLGYLPLAHHEASFFFRLFVPRYERDSLNVTNDKSFLKWREGLNHHDLATGIIDRLFHHATTLRIKGRATGSRRSARLGCWDLPDASMRQRSPPFHPEEVMPITN